MICKKNEAFLSQMLKKVKGLFSIKKPNHQTYKTHISKLATLKLTKTYRRNEINAILSFMITKNAIKSL
jgi:hypothetical protein